MSSYHKLKVSSLINFFFIIFNYHKDKRPINIYLESLKLEPNEVLMKMKSNRFQNCTYSLYNYCVFFRANNGRNIFSKLEKHAQLQLERALMDLWHELLDSWSSCQPLEEYCQGYCHLNLSVATATCASGMALQTITGRW